MKQLNIKRTLGYAFYSDKELRKLLKSQAQLTAMQIYNAFMEAPINPTSGTPLPAYREILDDLIRLASDKN
jgi:hypothetical protein